MQEFDFELNCNAHVQKCATSTMKCKSLRESIKAVYTASAQLRIKNYTAANELCTLQMRVTV